MHLLVAQKASLIFSETVAGSIMALKHVCASPLINLLVVLEQFNLHHLLENQIRLKASFRIPVDPGQVIDYQHLVQQHWYFTLIMINASVDGFAIPVAIRREGGIFRNSFELPAFGMDAFDWRLVNCNQRSRK